MDNQPNNKPDTDDDKKEDTGGKDNEPKVYQDGGSSHNKHTNQSKP